MKTAPSLNGSVASLKKQLLERRHDARKGLATHVMDYDERPVRVAEEDQASLSHDEYIVQAMNLLDWRTLREVDLALERIDKGEYGICQECEEPISVKRLKAVPWARLCLECQDRRSLDDAERWEESPGDPSGN